MTIGVRASHAKRSSRNRSPTVSQPTTGVLVEDTVSGCQDRALADLAIAATMDTANGRLRMERSASSWLARANWLETEHSTAHRSRLRVEWDEEDVSMAAPGSAGISDEPATAFELRKRAHRKRLAAALTNSTSEADELRNHAADDDAQAQVAYAGGFFSIPAA